ncbi:MAG: serine hydrolase [Kordiimonadaceae bacterium]|nr:serine hydrolase [Kordiimonadaceae bacterium]
MTGITSAKAVPQSIGSARDVYAGRLMPTQQIHTFRNISQLFPTRTVSRGKDVKSQYFSYAPKSLTDMEIKTDHGTYDIYDYVGRNRVTALLVIKNGAIAHESYEYGNTANTKWMSMSMAKSVSTTLVGAAIKDGFIKSLDDQLATYLPSLKGSSYDGVSIRHLLQMTSGVQWDETHTNPSSERRAVLELQLAQKPGAILKYMAKLPRLAEPGTRWNYSTGETHVVGELLYAATGEYLSDYLSRKIWSKLGMEAEASWWLEAADGLEVAGSGISATLRDYGRFAQFVMKGGKIGNTAILPDDWLEQATTPREIAGEPLNYGFMWWPVQPPEGATFQQGFGARGIFGQYMYINPAEQTVVIVWSARAKPMHTEFILDNDFFNAVVGALK